MKTMNLKRGLFGLMILAGSVMHAQKITGDVGKTEDKGKSSVLNGTVRVIDNKGTKKFLQVQNGLTLLSDDTPDGGIVSTWQLGGTLTDDTYIDASGKNFSLDGLKLIPSTIVAATSATTESVGTNGVTISGSGTAATETGWTVLVRDEATGEINKILLSDLVESGQMEVTATADGTVPEILDVSIPSEYEKVHVYRNGAKLRANTDYTVAAGAVTLVPQTTAPNDWAIYDEDLFEIQWIN
jgi:hypothetical protein